jgi:hypothetical protein
MKFPELYAPLLGVMPKVIVLGSRCQQDCYRQLNLQMPNNLGCDICLAEPTSLDTNGFVQSFGPMRRFKPL